MELMNVIIPSWSDLSHWIPEAVLCCTFLAALLGDLLFRGKLPSGIGLDDAGFVHGGVAEDFGGNGGSYDWNIDLYLGRPVASNAFYLKAEQSDPSATIPNFVGVSLDGGQGYPNQTGIGAVIEVEAGSLTQTKRIDGGSMRGSQASRNLTFGLGDYSGPVTATIT